MELKVGIVKDDRYLLHQPGLVHPERAARVKGIYRMLEKEFDNRLIHIEPEPATLEQLELVHTPSYVKKILKTSERDFTTLAVDTQVSSDSYVSAWWAVGGCIRGLHSLLSGRCDACFCLVRPPGHHALSDRAGGFCIFNNLAITAKYALERYDFQRILIIDWDIHHGNGIQDIFYHTDKVLYFSSHYSGWFPYTGEWHETGEAEGLGYTINVPISKDIEDTDLVYVYWKILGSVMKQYRPDLILVAAGFDGHHRDPVGRTKLTEAAFRYLTEILLEFRDALKSPPLLFALEGGYDVGALASCVKEVLDVLTFSGRRPKIPVAISSRGKEIVEKAQQIHREYRIWSE